MHLPLPCGCATGNTPALMFLRHFTKMNVCIFFTGSLIWYVTFLEGKTHRSCFEVLANNAGTINQRGCIFFFFRFSPYL